MVNVSQFIVNRNQMYGMKRVNETLNKTLNINQVNLTDKFHSLTLIPDILTKYPIYKSEVNHFTEPMLAFIHEVYNPKNSIISLFDTIGEEYYANIDRSIKYRKRNMHKFDRILTISEYSKNDIQRVYNIDRSKIDVMYCGVDTNEFYPIEEVEHDENIINLTYIGNALIHKNLSFMIDMTYRLQKQTDKNVILNRYGYDLPFDKSYNMSLNYIINKAKILGVNFVNHGYIDDILSLYNTTDVYINTSLCEGFDLPILEAMACGTPVVTSNTSSHPEVLGDVAKLVDFDIEQWCEAILWSIDNRKYTRSSLINRAKEFTWGKSADKLMMVYESF